jgi:hypothetical protein
LKKKSATLLAKANFALKFHKSFHSNPFTEDGAMKKLTSVLLAVSFLLSLGACAGMRQDAPTVKCPACGYEMKAPLGGG